MLFKSKTNYILLECEVSELLQCLLHSIITQRRFKMDESMRERRRQALLAASREYVESETQKEAAQDYDPNAYPDFSMEGLHPSAEADLSCFSGDTTGRIPFPFTKDPYGASPRQSDACINVRNIDAYHAYRTRANAGYPDPNDNPYRQYYGQLTQPTMPSQNDPFYGYPLPQPQYPQYYQPQQIQQSYLYQLPTNNGFSVSAPPNPYPQYQQPVNPYPQQVYQPAQPQQPYGYPPVQPQYQQNPYCGYPQAQYYYQPQQPVPYMQQPLNNQVRDANGTVWQPTRRVDHLRMIMLLGKPEGVSGEDWAKEVNERLAEMSKPPKPKTKEEIEKEWYDAMHTYRHYTYDDNFERIEKSSIQMVLTGGKKPNLSSPPNDPKTGYHEIVYTKQDDMMIDMKREKIRNEFYQPDAFSAVARRVYMDMMDNPYRKLTMEDLRQPGNIWQQRYYKMIIEPSIRRQRLLMRLGNTSFKEFENSVNTYYDLRFSPTTNYCMYFKDPDLQKLAIDYQNNPDAYPQEVANMLTVAMRANFQDRKKKFMYDVEHRNFEVDMSLGKVDTTVGPSPQIIGTPPIYPEENGVIRGMSGRVLYDPRLKEPECGLSPEQKMLATEYEVNKLLAAYANETG